MFHASVEYRLWHVGMFFDTGSVWERNGDVNIRYSTGFGIHSDNSFFTIGFPLNSDNGPSAIFMAGARF
jgi:outer membrane translocation and assembly module TamA